MSSILIKKALELVDHEFFSPLGSEDKIKRGNGKVSVQQSNKKTSLSLRKVPNSLDVYKKSKLRDKKKENLKFLKKIDKTLCADPYARKVRKYHASQLAAETADSNPEIIPVKSKVETSIFSEEDFEKLEKRLPTLI